MSLTHTVLGSQDGYFVIKMDAVKVWGHDFECDANTQIKQNGSESSHASLWSCCDSVAVEGGILIFYGDLVMSRGFSILILKPKCPCFAGKNCKPATVVSAGWLTLFGAARWSPVTTTPAPPIDTGAKRRERQWKTKGASATAQPGRRIL